MQAYSHVEGTPMSTYEVKFVLNWFQTSSLINKKMDQNFAYPINQPTVEISKVEIYTFLKFHNSNNTSIWSIRIT